MPTKSKADRRPVCYGVISAKEWHVDFTLVPRQLRPRAVSLVREVLSNRGLLETAIFGFVFHHSDGHFEQRRLKGSQSMDIGDAVK